MTLHEFNALPEERQLEVALDTGTFLSGRWEDACRINLYALPGGLLVEMYYDTQTHQISRGRAFTSGGALAVYAADVRLPDGIAE